jgi:hypothetical protein
MQFFNVHKLYKNHPFLTIINTLNFGLLPLLIMLFDNLNNYELDLIAFMSFFLITPSLTQINFYCLGQNAQRYRNKMLCFTFMLLIYLFNSLFLTIGIYIRFAGSCPADR